MRALLSGMSFTPLPSVPDSNNTSDNNLRSAITAANNDTTADTDTITLQPGTYTLSLGQLVDSNTTAGHTLIIEGAASTGANASIINAGELSRVLSIAAGATVELEDLEITGGTAETDASGGTTEADGGGILNLGSLTLDDVAIVGNKTTATAADETAHGGGIYSTGSLTIEGTSPATSLIENNTASGGAGTSATPTGGNADAGGIYSNSASQLSISQTTIYGNIAQGGLGFDGSSSSANGGNGGNAAGGGVVVFNTSSSPAVFQNDAIANNQSNGGDGGDGATSMTGGNAGSGSGGGVAIGSAGTAAATFTNVTISGNTASSGTTGTGTTAGSANEAVGGGLFIESAIAGFALQNVTVASNSAPTTAALAKDLAAALPMLRPVCRSSAALSRETPLRAPVADC